MKHTPGPWEKVNGNLVGSDGNEVVAAGLGLGLGTDNGDGVRLANASLIKAAPDLLEALKTFPGFLCGIYAGDAWIEKMRAAIAKAEA